MKLLTALENGPFPGPSWDLSDPLGEVVYKIQTTI